MAADGGASPGRAAARPPRVGLSGHRPSGLGRADLEELRGCVRAVLSRLWAPSDAPDASPPGATVVSSLAEGADRLAVAEALAAGFAFEGILPFGRDDFARDFPSEASRAEYRALLARAAAVTELPGSRAAPGGAEDAYVAANLAMLGRIDLLLAVWDGEPARGRGGTAEVIEDARRRGLPVVWVAARPPHEVRFLANGHEVGDRDGLAALAGWVAARREEAR